MKNKNCVDIILRIIDDCINFICEYTIDNYTPYKEWRWYLFYYLLKPLFICRMIVWFLTKRLICHIKGCEIRYYYIDIYLIEAQCLRCGNWEDYTDIGRKSVLIEK